MKRKTSLGWELEERTTKSRTKKEFEKRQIKELDDEIQEKRKNDRVEPIDTYLEELEKAIKENKDVKEIERKIDGHIKGNDKASERMTFMLFRQLKIINLLDRQNETQRIPEKTE